MVTVKGNVADFRFFRPQARQVYVVGDFNNWKPAQMQMQRDEGGYWASQLRLPPGTFKFRYWADGEWFTDFAAFGVEYGPFGFDSIVRIPAGETEPAQAAAGQSAPAHPADSGLFTQCAAAIS
jgi:1,4-alpha-glucan branching enzyme